METLKHFTCIAEDDRNRYFMPEHGALTLYNEQEDRVVCVVQVIPRGRASAGFDKGASVMHCFDQPQASRQSSTYCVLNEEGLTVSLAVTNFLSDRRLVAVVSMNDSSAHVNRANVLPARGGTLLIQNDEYQGGKTFVVHSGLGLKTGQHVTIKDEEASLSAGHGTALAGAGAGIFSLSVYREAGGKDEAASLKTFEGAVWVTGVAKFPLVKTVINAAPITTTTVSTTTATKFGLGLGASTQRRFFGVSDKEGFDEVDSASLFSNSMQTSGGSRTSFRNYTLGGLLSDSLPAAKNVSDSSGREVLFSGYSDHTGKKKASGRVLHYSGYHDADREVLFANFSGSGKTFGRRAGNTVGGLFANSLPAANNDHTETFGMRTGKKKASGRALHFSGYNDADREVLFANFSGWGKTFGRRAGNTVGGLFANSLPAGKNFTCSRGGPFSLGSKRDHLEVDGAEAFDCDSAPPEGANAMGEPMDIDGHDASAKYQDGVSSSSSSEANEILERAHVAGLAYGEPLKEPTPIYRDVNDLKYDPGSMKNVCIRFAVMPSLLVKPRDQAEAEMKEVALLGRPQMVPPQEGEPAVHTSTECVACMDATPNIRFITCNHVVICGPCSKSWPHTCPVCRELIQATVEVPG